MKRTPPGDVPSSANVSALLTTLSEVVIENSYTRRGQRSFQPLHPVVGLHCCSFDTHFVAKSVAVRRHISWHLAAWGIPLPCNIQLLAVQRARTQVERKKLSRSALQRQNLAKMRFSPAEKCYSHFKQPCQRLCNY
ncbi:uncharacterized protein si:ch211-260e23.9 isoform X3 [Siniperca chuatsi]|uniref:uncharacterized protein si:ch211-260e23.9 isoform X3 n=1 Tax=Siniperca chuatsi TaxID=119488 RepID=UPI001CE10A55|nr:uncharacterized protein si:ch211-260e23.9 isoform X3 [Siniperca chuatsi]